SIQRYQHSTIVATHSVQATTLSNTETHHNHGRPKSKAPETNPEAKKQAMDLLEKNTLSVTHCMVIAEEEVPLPKSDAVDNFKHTYNLLEDRTWIDPRIVTFSDLVARQSHKLSSNPGGGRDKLLWDGVNMATMLSYVLAINDDAKRKERFFAEIPFEGSIEQNEIEWKFTAVMLQLEQWKGELDEWMKQTEGIRS
ncbi:hypothetical protein EJ04DRAFT_595068, partial [Polyplosphaeria fusca]